MRSVSSVVVVISCLLLGCASDRDAIDKRLTELRDDIKRLQSSNDALAERLDSLEVKVASTPTSHSGNAAAEPRVERPPLRVVRVVPGADGAVGDPGAAAVAPEELPDAPGTRPVIRLRGKDGAASREGVARKTEEREGTP